MFQIVILHWYGFRALPGTAKENACWPNTPVFVTEVVPLKTGKGLLRISTVEALQPVAPRTRTITLRIRQHDSAYLIGTFLDDAGVEQTLMVSEIDEGWIKQHCHDWWRRFPMRRFANPFWEPAGIDTQTYLARAFPGEPDAIGQPVVLTPGAIKPLPEARAQIMVRHEFDEMDSYLIRRGFQSSVMEEKWDACFSEGHLRLYRSWTGYLIYEIPMTIRGARLYAGSILVNRDRAQHTCDDDEHDKAMCGYVISRVLLGLPAEYPAEPGLTPTQAAISAWAAAGTASQ